MCEIVCTAKGWKKILLDVKGWIVALFIFSMIFSYYKSLESPVNIIKTIKEIPVAYNGNYYKLCREVEYNRDSALTIDRAFIKNTESGDIYTISLAPLTVTRNKGVYKVCRYILIPENIEVGNWIIKTYATYNYFIWKHTVEIEDIPIEIKG